MTNNLQERVNVLIRNKQDLSILLKNKDLSNLDLGGGIIASLNMADLVINNTNFNRCIIGNVDDPFNMNRVKLMDCTFKYAQFPGEVWARRGSFIRCDFSDAFCPYVSYAFSKFSNCKFCNTVWTIGTRAGLGAIFDENFFQDLSNLWGVEVRLKQKSKE